MSKINKEKIFKLRYEHIKYISDLMKSKLEELYKKYGEEYKSILINGKDNPDIYIREDSTKFSIINYIYQRAEKLKNQYEKEEIGKD